MSETPRYRCASEKGFFAEPTEIAFAQFDYRVGVGQRAEQNDEFDFEGVPGAWMDPINAAAEERVAALVAQKKRKSLHAEVSAPTEPVRPPKSGLRAMSDQDTFNDIRDMRPREGAPPTLSNRPAPRRRAPAQKAV